MRCQRHALTLLVCEPTDGRRWTHAASTENEANLNHSRMVVVRREGGEKRETKAEGDMGHVAQSGLVACTVGVQNPLRSAASVSHSLKRPLRNFDRHLASSLA